MTCEATVGSEAMRSIGDFYSHNRVDVSRQKDSNTKGGHWKHFPRRYD